MKRRPAAPEVDLTHWDEQSGHERSRLVLEWLGDDQRRAELYTAIRERRGGVLAVPSRARHEDDDCGPPAGAAATQQVLLVADPDLVCAALTDGATYSNAPYQRLGSGDFMLGLDLRGSDPHARDSHADQVAALHAAFGAVTGPDLQALAAWAVRAAATTVLGERRFDAATFAENAALRYVQVLFGYPRGDLADLRRRLATAYRAMTVQMLGRHFVTEPLTLGHGRIAMGELAARSAQLIQEYALGSPDWPEDLEEPGDGLPALTPVLKSLAHHGGALDGQGRAVLVVGALAGTVGNIQAASCIALAHLLADPRRLAAARRALHAHPQDPQRALWADHVAPALRANPAAPFLPRRMARAAGRLPMGADIVLCVGSATQTLAAQDPALADALVFGLDAGHPLDLHPCLGAHLARTLTCHVVGQLARLLGLEEVLDETDARPLALSKRWGFACLSYPLLYRRDRRVRQQPLNVAMRVRSPLATHGEALRRILSAGAPRIDRLLKQSRHVHFAWFEFLEDGHVLMLHTVFDGDFEAYLQHFALQAGDMFDLLFQHLEGAPPRPVKEHPEAFVRCILAHHRGPAEGYFFSAYPHGDTPAVLRALPPAPRP